jgi:hypothetical protein
VGSARMVIMQVDREFMTKRLVAAYGILEQLLLQVSGKLRPYFKRCPADFVFKT